MDRHRYPAPGVLSIIHSSQRSFSFRQLACSTRHTAPLEMLSLETPSTSSLLCLLLLLGIVSSSCPLFARPAPLHAISTRSRQTARYSNLQIGKVEQAPIKGHQRSYYRLPLVTGHFSRLELTTVDCNVVFRLSSPTGEKLLEVDTTDGPGGTRPLFWTAQSTGDYLVEIGSTEGTALIGRYSLELQEIRAVAPNDGLNIEAQADFLQGEALRRSENGESLQAAIPKYQRAADLWKTTGQTAQQAQALIQLALDYNGLSRNTEAIAPLSEALSLATEIGDTALRSAALHNLGEVYYALGDKKKALNLFNNALLLRHSAGEAPQEADTLNDIAVVYDDMSQAQSALTYYNRALDLKHKTGDRASEASILSNIGIVYDNLGETNIAIEHYESAVAAHRALHHIRALGVVLNNVGTLYHHIGDDQLALEYYEQALALVRQANAQLDEGRTLSNIGRSYATLGREQDALEYFNRALPIREAVGDRRGLAYTLSYMGDTYLTMGEREKARDYFNRALALAQQTSAPSIESTTRYGIARLDFDVGDRAAAQGEVEKALAIIEELRSEVQVRSLRSSYLATVQPVYEFYIDLLMSLDRQNPGQGYSAKAMEAAEKARARSLLEMLVEAQVDIRRGADPQLLDRELSLQNSIDKKSEQAFRLQNRKHTTEELAVIHSDLDALVLEHEAVQAQIRASSTKYSALPQAQPLVVAELQRLLDADTVLLQYSLGDQRSYVWVVTQNSLSSVELSARSQIESAAGQLYTALTARDQAGKYLTATAARSPVAVGESRYQQLANELGRMVLEPVSGLPPAKRLVIISDGALQYIPFGILPLPHSPDLTGRSAMRSVSLIENYEIVNLPSASVLSALRHESMQRPAATKLVAVLADPVFDARDPRVIANQPGVAKDPRAVHHFVTDDRSPMSVSTDSRLTRSASDVGLAKDALRFNRLSFSREEAASIMSMVPEDSGLEALDFNANRATATSPVLAQYRIVHFATHGLLDSQHPELSGLVLSLVDKAGRPQNGFVELEDIYNLNLHADLVVLSACETGLGKNIKGEGLVGLTRGFMYAGAPRVVASLWKVDDVATEELMKRFYKYMLQQHFRPAAALRAAQLEMSQQERWAEPYYWAGFTIQGEWR